MKFNNKLFDKLVLNKNDIFEQLKPELKKITDQIDELYLSIDADMSVYKTLLYSEKLILIASKKNRFANEYKRKVLKSYNTHLYLSIFKNILLLFLTNITQGMGLINLIFALTGLYVSYQCICSIYDSVMFMLKRDTNILKIEEDLNRLDITLENSKNSLIHSMKLSKRTHLNMDLTSKKNQDYLVAENLIINFLCKDYTIDDVVSLDYCTEDVKKLMIKILQNDLNSKEESLEKLLTHAKEKINNLKEQSSKILKLEKKPN